MKEKLTKQEVAEAKKEAKAFGQMKKKFKSALIDELKESNVKSVRKIISSKTELI
jgi:hypothetical protein